MKIKFILTSAFACLAASFLISLSAYAEGKDAWANRAGDTVGAEPATTPKASNVCNCQCTNSIAPCHSDTYVEKPEGNSCSDIGRSDYPKIPSTCICKKADGTTIRGQLQNCVEALRPVATRSDLNGN